MKLAHLLLLSVVLATAPAALAQRWEFGVGAGGGFYTAQDVEREDGTTADAKIKPGVAGTVFLGNNTNDWLGGELRYTFQMGDLNLKSGSGEASFGAQSHAIHYDFLWHAASQSATARPYIAFGGGVKIYQGTGSEREFQPLDQFALLTKTRDLRPMGSVGAGVKLRLADRWQLRLDVHDYITPFPKKVIEPNVGSKVSGLVHDIIPMFAIVYTSED